MTFEKIVGLSSLLVTRDPALSQRLSYLFQVILKHDFSVLESLEHANDISSLGRENSLVLVHVGDEPDHAFRQIKALKAGEGQPTVIAIAKPGLGGSVQAFAAGADDCVDYASPLQDLASRASVRLGYHFEDEAADFNDIQWDTEAYIAEHAHLTSSEAQILRVLYSHQGEIVSRDDLSYAIDEKPWQYGDRKFDVHIAKIRKKVSGLIDLKITVATVRSAGYLLSIEASGSGTAA